MLLIMSHIYAHVALLIETCVCLPNVLSLEVTLKTLSQPITWEFLKAYVTPEKVVDSIFLLKWGGGEFKGMWFILPRGCVFLSTWEKRFGVLLQTPFREGLRFSNDYSLTWFKCLQDSTWI